MAARERSKIILLLIVFSSVFLIPMHLVTSARAEESSTIADADTYVDGHYGGSNFGGQTSLYAGYATYYVTYIHFDLSTEPQGITQARIKFHVWSVTSTTDLTVTIITTQWGEYSMTWINKPSGSISVNTITIPESGFYYVDITDYIAGKNNISICLGSTTISNVGIASMDSREASVSSNRPMIIWTYPTSPLTIGLIIAGASAAVAIVIVGFLVIRRKHKRIASTSISRTEPVPRPSTGSPEVAQTPSNMVPATDIPSNIHYCPYCGNQLPEKSIFCNACGKKQLHPRSMQINARDLTSGDEQKQEPNDNDLVSDGHEQELNDKKEN